MNSKLTNLQTELLKIFSFELSDQQLKEVRNLLANYFVQKSTEEMNKSWAKSGWPENLMQKWSQKHERMKADKKSDLL